VRWHHWVKSSADLRALLFERIVSTVAVQVKTRREQPMMHFLDGQPRIGLSFSHCQSDALIGF
jgi:hypothetical protein